MQVVKKENNFKSLYSTKQYEKNELIWKLIGEIKKNPTRTSIEISKECHIEDEWGQYMNHSFTPNCKIENGYIVSLKEIDKNEELTFNYNENETKMAHPFYDSKTNKDVKGKA